MDHKQKGAIAVAVAAGLGGAQAADAAVITATLTDVLTYSGNGSSAGNIKSSTATFEYDTVTNLVSQTGGLYNVRFTITPTTTLFRTSITGLVIGNGGAGSATDFVCAEGNFGPSVGASLCGNYNFGANQFNESTATWGPGTAISRTLGGDDMALGPQQSIVNQYSYFTTVTFAGTSLVLSNAACNPFAPGNANNCATTGGFNTGLSLIFSVPEQVIPVPAAAWLFGSALGLLGVARRKLGKA